MSLIRPSGVVVFDFNGTLLDDLHIAYGSVKEIFRTYDIPCPTLTQYREEISADFMKFYRQHGFPLTTTADELNEIRKKFYNSNGGAAQVRPDVCQTLNWLNTVHFNTAIVSAEIAVTLYRLMIRAGIQKKFDFIRPESWDGKLKALLQTAEVFGCQPQDMIYIDDTVDGLTAAKNVGVVPVAFTNATGYNSSHRLMQVADVNINEIGDLKELLKS